MNSNGNTKDQLIKKQQAYIRQLEEQLAVYEEKDKAQELLIENLNRALALFAEEVSGTKTLKEEKNPGRDKPV